MLNLINKSKRFTPLIAPTGSADAVNIVVKSGRQVVVDNMANIRNVQTPRGELIVLEIKPAGGKVMTWEAFVNGRHVQPGDRFVPVEPQ